jgi:hypothetical protein
MWIPKWMRDPRKGVDSAISTQAVSNEEFVPRPQTREQRAVEALNCRLMPDDHARAPCSIS